MERSLSSCWKHATAEISRRDPALHEADESRAAPPVRIGAESGPMARPLRTARRARLALAAAVCASVAADRPAAGATMPLTDGGLLECEPPRRLLHTAIEWQSRTYDFAGTCRRIRKDGVAPIYFTIHGQWHPEEKVALEVIEVQAERSAKGQLRLKATCADDPWLTRNPCTLLSFVDQEGAPGPPSADRASGSEVRGEPDGDGAGGSQEGRGGPAVAPAPRPGRSGRRRVASRCRGGRPRTAEGSAGGVSAALRDPISSG